ncbi:outer membrane protein assembly factor BamA [Pelagibacterales bacterium SAG-MED33]|nr:outer membrane protein assembly factor BamA [Pelagibacterales bacterium SAG-MED33]
MSIQHFKFKYLYIFLIFFISLEAKSEILKDINIEGNQRIPDETIIMFGNVNIQDNLNLNEIDNILKNIYNSNFFEDVQVTLENNVLNIYVKEKPIIQNVEYEGIKSKTILAEIKSNRILKPKSSFDKNLLQKDSSNILKTLKNIGYFFPSVENLVEDSGNENLNLIYKIDLGSKSKIKKISFVGDKVYKDKKLKNIIISEEYKFWKFISGRKFLNENLIDLDKRLLKNFYLNKGYYNAKVNSSFAKLVNDNQFELIYNINANEKYYFDNINLELDIDYDENNFSDLKSSLKKLKGKPYSINNISKIIKTIENIVLREQFESIKVIPLENLVDNKINLTFKVEESEKFFVKKINIFGNNITQENVIRNQFEIDEGDPFNEILYNKTLNNIKSLGFFKEAGGEIQDIEGDNAKIINISVEEKATGEISLGAGAGTDGATIAFGVKENNFLGKGVSLTAGATLTEETIKGKFSVKNPNYKNTDKSIYVNFEALEIDRSTEFGYKTNKTGFSFGTDFEVLDDFDLGLGLSNFYEKITTDSSASALQKTQEGNYWDSFLKLDFDNDKRNQKFQTSDGYRSFYSIDIPLVSDTNTLVNSYQYNYYNELFEDNITNASIYLQSANSITGDNIKLSERLYIPGRKLRGFERGKVGPKDGEDYIGGNFVTTANLSTTLPQILSNIQEVDFVMFLDAANIWGVDYDSSIDDDGSFRSSVGLGIDWMTPIGPLNFIFAQPITKENSDKTQTFRFNLGTTF